MRGTVSIPGLVLGLGLVGGCAERITEVPLDGLDFSYAFLVTADAAGQPRRVVDTIGFDDARGPLPGATLEAGEARFFVISLRQEDLQLVAPGFEPGRAGELELELSAPPTRQVFDAASRRLHMPLPAGTRVHVGDVEPFGVLTELAASSLSDARLSREVSLMVPVDDEHCRRPGQTDLAPFASSAATLPDAFGGSNLGVESLAFVDEDRIFVAAATILTWLDRGQPFELGPKLDPYTPARWIDLRDLVPAETGELVSVAAVSPTVDGEGRREILVGGGVPPDPEMQQIATLGWVRRAQLGPDGIAWVDEPPQVLSHYPRSIAYLDDGRAMVGSHLGRFWVRTATVFEPLTDTPRLLRPDDDDVARIRTTRHPQYPYLVGTKGGLHVWDEEAGRWLTTEIEQSRILSPEALKFLGMDTEVVDGKLGIYLTSQNGDLIWRSTRLEVFNQPELPYPARFAECASATNDDRLIYERRPIIALEAQGGYLYMAYADCSALVLLPRPEGPEDPQCITVLPVEGEPVRHLDDPLQHRAELAARPGEVAMATQHGAVYVTRW